MAGVRRRQEGDGRSEQERAIRRCALPRVSVSQGCSQWLYVASMLPLAFGCRVAALLAAHLLEHLREHVPCGACLGAQLRVDAEQVAGLLDEVLEVVVFALVGEVREPNLARRGGKEEEQR